jgi:hypothetical protein
LVVLEEEKKSEGIPKGEEIRLGFTGILKCNWRKGKGRKRKGKGDEENGCGCKGRSGDNVGSINKHAANGG